MANKQCDMTKNPVGRPSKYKERYCDEVIAHMADGASLTSFAAEIGVARSTIGEWVDDHDEFSVAVKKAKAKCAAWWEKLGRKNAQTGQGNATLVIFGLKNMAPDEWREKQELSITSRSTVKIDPDMKPEDAARAYQDLMGDE
jgi:hypothetical protein